MLFVFIIAQSHIIPKGSNTTPLQINASRLPPHINGSRSQNSTVGLLKLSAGQSSKEALSQLSESSVDNFSAMAIVAWDYLKEKHGLAEEKSSNHDKTYSRRQFQSVKKC